MSAFGIEKTVGGGPVVGIEDGFIGDYLWNTEDVASRTLDLGGHADGLVINDEGLTVVGLVIDEGVAEVWTPLGSDTSHRPGSREAIEAIEWEPALTDQRGFGYDPKPHLCVRCMKGSPPLAGGDFCEDCRAFLLEDSDNDPLEPGKTSLFPTAYDGGPAHIGDLLGRVLDGLDDDWTARQNPESWGEIWSP